jgi:nucleoside-diphosphate-sugar epimerase
MKILYTGAKGFIAGYTIQKFLDEGHSIIGIDNNWKYGYITKQYDNHPKYLFLNGDATNKKFLDDVIDFYEPDIFIMGAALIGGISFFHTFAYDLLSENEKITATSFDAAIKAYKNNKLKKVVVLSSSMVFENATEFPTSEGHEKECPPPLSSYGFQKLSTEYFAKAAYRQYGLPYIIVRPFNCAGIGEYRAKVDVEIKSGNVNLAMSHVIPDLIQKIYKGQNPLHILGKGNQIRHYTYGGDLAEGIYLATMSQLLNEDYNLSTSKGHNVLQLAKIIWNKMKPDVEFDYLCDEPFEYDVANRVPDTSKASNLLSFNPTTSLDKILEETIPWVTAAVDNGLI